MNMTLLCDFRIVFHTASAFGTGNGNDTGGILLSGLVFLITGWMELCAQPEATHFKTLDVIHERYTRPHTRPEPSIARQIHSE
jgi:hypothetical protein